MRSLFRFSPLRLALLVAVLIIVGYRYDSLLSLPQQIEWRILDYRFRSRGEEREKAQNTPVTIVAIDEKTLSELGRWPFSRSYMGDLIRKLREYGTRVIAFDIVFAEEDTNSELTKVREIRALARKLGLGDERSAGAVTQTNRGLALTSEGQKDAESRIRSLSGQVRTQTGRQQLAGLDRNSRQMNDGLRELKKGMQVLQKQGTGIVELDRYLKEAEIKANNDHFLASVMAEKEDIVLGYFMRQRTEEFAHLSTEAAQERLQHISDSRVLVIRDARQGPPPKPRILYGNPFGVVVPNIPSISEAGKWDGHFVQLPDADGGIRWYPAIIDYQGEYFPALGVQAVARYLDENISVYVDDGGNLNSLTIGEHEIPLDNRGSALINYRGGTAAFKTVSFIDVLRGRVNAEDLRDRIVLIGPTATGIFDLRVTPFDSLLPGVEIHANAISNILHNDFLQKPAWMKVFDVASLLAIGLALGLLLAPLPSLFAGVIVTLVTIAYLWLSDYMLWHYGIWMTTLYQLADIVFGFVAVLLFKYITEERKRKEIKNAFQFYLNPEVVEEVIKDPSRLQLGGEKRELSILFSDIRGFTTISEKLDAQELSLLLNEYLTPMTNLVFDYKGTLDKYIGDALMAFFGAPHAYRDHGHAWRAGFVATDMLDKLAELKQQWAERGLPEIDIGIGINTGEVSVGNMGSAQRFDYTVLGDAVNLASRLEGINKMYKTHIVISEYTKASAGDKLYTRELDAVRVKGKLDPVRIFELIGKQENPELAPAIRLFETGLAEYRASRFADAIRTFAEVERLKKDDGPSRIFIERCQLLQKEPPPEGWDGVFTLNTK